MTDRMKMQMSDFVNLNLDNKRFKPLNDSMP